VELFEQQNAYLFCVVNYRVMMLTSAVHAEEQTLDAASE